MYAVTRTGTTVKRFQTEAKSGTSGNNLGIAMLPASSFTMAMPAVITTKTIARATDKADVNLRESDKTQIIGSELQEKAVMYFSKVTL